MRQLAFDSFHTEHCLTEQTVPSAEATSNFYQFAWTPNCTPSRHVETKSCSSFVPFLSSANRLDANNCPATGLQGSCKRKKLHPRWPPPVPRLGAFRDYREAHTVDYRRSPTDLRRLPDHEPEFCLLSVRCRDADSRQLLGTCGKIAREGKCRSSWIMSLMCSCKRLLSRLTTAASTHALLLHHIASYALSF